MSEFVKSLIKDIIIALLLAAAILFFIRPTVVRGVSMQDTLNPGDYLIMYRQAYRNKDPQRGDIVILHSELKDENGNDKLLIKRVIGLPGDTITIRNGQVYINGDKYNENYLRDGYTTENGTWKVPGDSYFVMGDNRVESYDSRAPEIGYIGKDQIRGRAVVRLFPFNKITKL